VPELPEVEMARRLATRVAVGRRIVDVWCASDPIVIEGVTPARLGATLRGRRVREARRHGKHLWLELDRCPSLLMHFGMTGGLHVPTRPPLRLKSTRGSIPPGWPPRFVKLRLTFDDGGELAMADARRLGRIRLRDDPRREPPVADLGFDALHELPAAGRFLALVRELGLPEPDVNVQIEGYLADFSWPDRRLVVEIDPHEFHRTRFRIEADKRRDAALLVAGWHTVRVTEGRLDDEPDGLGAQLQALLAV
jgi:very-short-patch-repair endonuclease